MVDVGRQQIGARQHGAGDLGHRHLGALDALQTELAIAQLDHLGRRLHEHGHHLAHLLANPLARTEHSARDRDAEAAASRAE